ncbi:hypothetical protein [Pseudomonas sp. EA_15y_Pfl2_R67]|uniref:hypothetical protein n=1 Tax=Pseudomonas sp. EA_15y_Pfl2_R67 TaxID=3088687 RepID=UPI0030DA7AB3
MYLKEDPSSEFFQVSDERRAISGRRFDTDVDLALATREQKDRGGSEQREQRQQLRQGVEPGGIGPIH